MLDYTSLTPVVESAARKAAANFPSHHDVSDVKQELWVWIMENKETVNGIVRDSMGTLTALEQLLLRAATTYLKREDAATYGYDQSDRFYYSTNLIKQILEVIFRHEDWQSFATALDAMPKGKSDPATAGNNLASYADVSAAVDRLPEEQYNAIVWRYKYQKTIVGVGEAMGFGKTKSEGLLNAAVSAIQKDLGELPLAALRSGHSGRTEPSSGHSGQVRVDMDYEG